MPGFNNFPGIMRTLNSPDVDVLVIGETREWEGIEYARDVNTAGKQKGLIVLGHVPSEERGMEECAKWLKTFITKCRFNTCRAATRSGGPKHNAWSARIPCQQA
jgi:hypothetical protein